MTRSMVAGSHGKNMLNFVGNQQTDELLKSLYHFAFPSVMNNSFLSRVLEEVDKLLLLSKPFL